MTTLTAPVNTVASSTSSSVPPMPHLEKIVKKAPETNQSPNTEEEEVEVIMIDDSDSEDGVPDGVVPTMLERLVCNY